MWLINEHREVNSGTKGVTAVNQLPVEVQKEIPEIISTGESNHSFAGILKNIISYSDEQIEAENLFFTKCFYNNN